MSNDTYMDWCADCPCLMEDADREWYCDELQKKCKFVTWCPEFQAEINNKGQLGAGLVDFLKDLFEKSFENVAWKPHNDKWLGEADDGGYTEGQMIDEIYDYLKNIIPMEK